MSGPHRDLEEYLRALRDLYAAAADGPARKLADSRLDAPFGEVPEPELGWVLDRLAPEPPEGPPTVEPPGGRARLGKAYPAEAAVEVVLHVLDKRPSRALRDELYRELHPKQPAVTTTLIDHVLGLMRERKLSPTRRKRWERAAARLLEDGHGSATLAELEQRLK